MIIFRPLSAWTLPAVVPRSDQFRASWDKTIELLQDEANMLSDSRFSVEIVVECDVDLDDISVHDRLKAGRFPRSVRVAVVFDSRLGRMRYEVATFDSWRANVRAVAVGLRALRAVERYGIGTRGEQYVGWKELGSGIALGPVMTLDDAARLICEHGNQALLEMGGWANLLSPVYSGLLTKTYRDAVRRAHPDAGGDAGTFDQLTKAYDLITSHQGATP